MFVPALLALACQVAAPAAAPAVAPAAASSSGAEILLWRRAPGPLARDVKGKSATVALSALPVVERDVKDDRGTAFHVRGVTLVDLLARTPKDDDATVEDLAILHFSNGTRIALYDVDVARFDVVVARAWRFSNAGAWSEQFEPVAIGTPHWKSGRSLVFGKNRVFAGNPLPPRGKGTFVPWGFVDSLVEVEWVNSAAWHAVWNFGDTDGHHVFENRCATCHGVRGAGARLGWDFVEPLALSTWRTPESLFDHVRAHKLNAAETGLLMPPQPDVTAAEIAALHRWMTWATAQKLAPYDPAAPKP